MWGSSALRLLRRAIVWPQWTFYRVHLTAFTITPIIAAGIFYAANGEVHIKFVDALFVCTSSMTVTGLVTFNISTATAFQQAILFFLMCIGNISAVSVTMVWVRRHFFRVKFDYIVKNSAKARQRADDVERKEERRKLDSRRRMKQFMGSMIGRDKEQAHIPTLGEKEANGDIRSSDSSGSSSEVAKEKSRFNLIKKRKGPLTADMVRRMDGPAVLVNQSGAPSRLVQDQMRHSGSEVLSPDQANFPTPGILNNPPPIRKDDNVDANGEANPANVRIALPEDVPHGHHRQGSGGTSHMPGDHTPRTGRSR